MEDIEVPMDLTNKDDAQKDANGGQSGLPTKTDDSAVDVIESEVANLFVIGIDNRTRCHKIRRSLTIVEIKKLLEPLDAEIRLLYATKELEDRKTLGYYQIPIDATLRIIKRLRGGMPKKKTKGTQGTIDLSEEQEVEEDRDEILENPVVSIQAEVPKQPEKGAEDLMKLIRDQGGLIKRISSHLDEIDTRNRHIENRFVELQEIMCKEFLNVKDSFKDWMKQLQ